MASSYLKLLRRPSPWPSATSSIDKTCAMTGSLSALFLLIDGRMPTGAHAHSGGVEQAVTDGAIHDVASLEEFLVGRMWTAGQVDAVFAAASVRTINSIAQLGYEFGARCPSSALRTASR